MQIVFIHKRQWLWQRLLAHVEAGLAVDESSWCAARDGNVTKAATVEVCQLAERKRGRERGRKSHSQVEWLHWSRNHIVLLIVPPDSDASDSSDDAFANS